MFPRHFVFEHENQFFPTFLRASSAQAVRRPENVLCSDDEGEACARAREYMH